MPQIKVMTVNLRFGLADDGKHSWIHRKNVYPALFRTIDPDFIGVQEANDFQVEFLSKILKGYRFIGKRETSNKSWQHNIIFYKNQWVCRENKLYFLSETPLKESKLDESKWPRQCTIGLFENGKNRLIHANTHFDFKSSVQEKSASFVLDFLKDFPENLPTVITGDFNTSPDSHTYTLFMEHGFRDLFEKDHSSTFHGFTGKDLGGHIDWILYRGDLHGIEKKIIRDSFEGVYPSDHYPVVTAFSFGTWKN